MGGPVDLRVAGIDWATQPKNRAVVALDVDGARWTCSAFQTPVEDADAVRWCRDESLAAVGVDIPFGWPASFRRFVAGWQPRCRDEAAGVPPDRAFRFRAADMAVHDAFARRGVRKWPLSVSTDRIALATAAWLRAVEAGQLGPQLDVGTAEPARKPRLLEVYPGGTLALLAHGWDGVDLRGYKDRPEVRERILARLTEEFPLAAAESLETAVMRAEGGHMLDALVAALTTSMCLQPPAGWTVLLPRTKPERDAADQEGWIWAAIPIVE